VDSVSEAYESIGYILEDAGNALRLNYRENYGESPVTGYNWTNAPTGTWIKETTAQGTVEVNPGYIAEIFQVAGRCGIYAASTNSFKEVGNNKQNVPFTRTFKL